MKFLSSFSLVVITGDILAGAIISLFLGQSVYPAWLWELFFSYYWFVSLFHSINRAYFNVFLPRSFIWDLKPLVTWLYSAHLVSAYILTFFILPLFHPVWWMRLLLAYPGCYLLVFVIPMQVAVVLYPRYQKKLETEKCSAKEIQDMARQCEIVHTFLRSFPDARSVVADNHFKNEVATCFFFHRKQRMEQPDLWEDAVLEVPVNMKRKEPLVQKIKTSRYIFRKHKGKCAVWQLPHDDLIAQHQETSPLDESTLSRFDAAFYRFPNLDHVPFSLAVRDVPFEMV